MEQNQKYNNQIKNAIVNASVGGLLDNQLLTEDELSGLEVHFAYVFSRDDGKIEALLRVEVPEKVFYFAVQDDKLQFLDLDDERYFGVMQYMEEQHPCLQSDELPETPAQKERREKNNRYLTENGITTAEHLMTRWDDENDELLDEGIIRKRAMVMFPVIQIACDIAQDNYKESMEFFGPMLGEMGAMEYLNSKERRIVDGSYTMQDAIDMDWAYESYWALCWCLGLVDDIKDAGDTCDCERAIEIARDGELAEKGALRDKAEILDMLDLYFRYTWAIYEARANQDAEIGNLNPSCVIERRRALEWVVSHVEDWYDLALQA